MQCTYCKVKQENKKICSFCEADLTQERPKKKQTLSQEEAYQTQPELSKYHTYDLLLLLSYLREQRSTAYKTMQSVRKAPNEVKTSRNDYDELNEYGQEFYREATARKNIIEQILIDRMGYYPKRVDNKELENFLSYLEDKTDDVYEREVQQAIKRFLDKQVTTVNGEIIKEDSSTNGPDCRIRHPKKIDINVGYRYKIVNKYT